MKKFMYDKLKVEYEKKTKEELMQQVMALQEIECSDRCFANHCEASCVIFSINELFNALNKSTVFQNNNEMLNIINSAKDNWNYIIDQIREINDNSRYYKAIDNFKKSIK